jgi:hypothetical protein
MLFECHYNQGGNMLFESHCKINMATCYLSFTVQSNQGGNPLFESLYNPINVVGRYLSVTVQSKQGDNLLFECHRTIQSRR